MSEKAKDSEIVRVGTMVLALKEVSNAELSDLLQTVHGLGDGFVLEVETDFRVPKSELLQALEFEIDCRVKAGIWREN